MRRFADEALQARADDAPLFAAVEPSRAEVVYAEFERIALDLIRRGRTHYSSDGILHVCRYHRIIAGEVGDDYRVNNSWSAEFARRFIAEHQEHSQFFELRRSKLDAGGAE